MRTRKLTEEQCRLLADKFPVMSNVDVARLLNVSVTTVKNYADIMELKKIPAYLSCVRKRASVKGLSVRWGIVVMQQTKKELIVSTLFA